MADLHALARAGNISELAVAIAKATAGSTRGKSSPLDARDQYNRTPLMLAAFEGHVAVLEMLVTEGCCGGECTMCGVVVEQHFTDCAPCSSTGASVQAVGKDQMTPLHFAASKGHTEAVRYLLNAGVVNGGWVHWGCTQEYCIPAAPLHSYTPMITPRRYKSKSQNNTHAGNATPPSSQAWYG